MKTNISLRLFVCSALVILAHPVNRLGAEEPNVSERTFRASDRSLEKYVLRWPANQGNRDRVRLLIALHGHGSDRWQFIRDKRSECRAVRDMADRYGWVVVSPDYRGRTSWMGPQAESDLLTLMNLLDQQYQVEAIVLCGGSMGGSSALTFTALHPAEIAGVISLNGTANLVEYKKFPEAIARSYGGTRDQIPSEYRRRSAEFFPERFSMPVAATTGGRDAVVPPDSVLRLIRAIRTRNPDVLSIHRPEGGHSTDYDDSCRAVEFVITRLQARSQSRNHRDKGMQR